MSQNRLLPGVATVSLLIAAEAHAQTADPEACGTVRMADPGWTDISSTNALLGNVLQGLGYEQTVDTLAVPVVFQALANEDIDVFLGNWMPSQTGFVEPLTKSGEVEVVAENLSGIRFTLAVPDYVAEAGVTDFSNLAEHAEDFGSEIYGIEPGAPANENIQRMIDAGDFGLGEWELVNSSEQGMLSQVERAVRRENWIVFLAWEPHPMNLNLPIHYLSGGDAYFGPDYGSATVYTVAREGYVETCPNLARLLKQTTFSVDMENEIMNTILDDGEEPIEAAKAWLVEHPGVIEPWLAGVTTIDGQEGLPAVKAHLGL